MPALHADFEGGNLLEYAKNGNDYTIKLRRDSNGGHHVQWFYFRVTRCEAGKSYVFHITNLTKPDSLFKRGMLPIVHDGVCWKRMGHDVTYKSNGDETFTLSFTIAAPSRSMYIAQSMPYSYSDLKNDIERWREKSIVSVLCKTRLGNDCWALTIGSGPKYVVLTARVHPGETNSSYVMRGTIEYLISDEAAAMRERYTFRIVPMLNPDGVILGNYRTSTTGDDLNRVWKHPSKRRHPTIWHAKKLINGHTHLFVDMHTHSRKGNAFVYGCEKAARDIPNRMCRMSNLVSRRGSDFTVQPEKDSCARIVVWKMGVVHSYTLETSYAGTSDSNGNINAHFSHSDLLDIGKVLIQSI